ncbi:MAG: hypothetical protein J1E61_05640 [Lachnospiraceae bacterium]|nr:hypothetical protein [Lachnospiraceae bacterium]
MNKKEKLEDVKDYFEKKKNSVEKENKAFTDKLGWKITDVLYSFQGIYAIGVYIYYPKCFSDKTNIKIYVKEKQNLKGQLLYSGSYLQKNYTSFSKVNELPEIKEFLKSYYKLGNLIPIWPGGNVSRGMAQCYDIPNVYFNSENKREFSRFFFSDFCSNAHMEEILSENQKYTDIKTLLNMNTKDYREFLEYIVGVIDNRTKKLINYDITYSN